MPVFPSFARHFGLFTAVLCFAALPAAAQSSPAPAPSEDFSIGGSVRARYEALDGQFRPGFDAADDLYSLRTIVTAEYRTGPVRIGAELYDSRVYGGEAGSAVSANDVNALELVQAWVAVDLATPLGTGSSGRLQAGRFMLNLGSRRLVAGDDYRNTTNGFTGLRADLRGRDGTAATLIYVLPQVRLPDDQPSVLDNKVAWDRESFDLVLWGGTVARPRTIAGALLEASYFRLRERDAPGRPTRDRDLHTAGVRLIREPAPGRVDFEAEAIFQTGRISASQTANAPRLDVSASFLHLDIGYTFPGPARLRMSLEYDRASGDGPGPRYGRFDTLFGMRRGDLAPAGIYAALGRTNISTPGVRIEAAPGRRVDGFIVYRALWAASATDSFSTTGIRDPAGASGSFAGHQLEGRLRYWLVPERLRAEFNAALLIKRGILVDAPNAPATGDTRYVSLALTAGF